VKHEEDLKGEKVGTLMDLNASSRTAKTKKNRDF